MAVTVDFDQLLLNFEGAVLKNEEDKPVRLGFIAGSALSRSWQGDDRDDKEQGTDWELAQKIGKSNTESSRYGSVRLENKEAAHIEHVIRKVYPMPLYSAQCAKMLEGPEEEEK